MIYRETVQHEELLARVRALLRRSRKQGHALRS
jgi:DNA-binding response OmpR family regulator